jgi:hypothetical protein
VGAKGSGGEAAETPHEALATARIGALLFELWVINNLLITLNYNILHNENKQNY